MSSTVTGLSTETIARTLVERCRAFQFEEAKQELYSPHIVSVEAMAMPDTPREIKGLDAVIEKGKRWASNSEIHHMEVSEPMVAGSQFAVKFTMDMTCKMTNKRMNMEEIAVYQVAEGKIIHEQFFYDVD